MSEALHGEARALVAAARALLEEAYEEGLERYEPSAAPADPEVGPPQATPPPRLERPAAQEAPTRGAPPPAPRTAPRPEPRPPPSVGQAFALDGASLDGAERFEWTEATTLDQVRDALGDCTRCGLCSGRSTIVFGDGDPRARLMFVGEGPGEQEDRSGLPFVGRAGELLTQMIEKGLGISRSSVYICNVVKCRPPNNRTPLADEVAKCRPFLHGQIAAVKPSVIVALGKPAASLLLGRDVAITRVRGTWQDYHGIPVMPTFHPAFILRQYTPENRRLVWEDLKAAQARCDD